MTASKVTRAPKPLRLLLSSASALVAHPKLWPSGVAAGLELVPRQWWRRRPYLPVPSSEWLGFRMETAYGSPDALPPADDILAFVAFAHEQRQLRRAMPKQPPYSH